MQCSIRFTRKPENGPEEVRSGIAGNRTGGLGNNFVVIVCYAPTNEADDLAKDNFWNQLSSLVSSFKQREIVCLVGDFNVQPGQQSDVNVPCRGPFGMGEENDNSKKLLSFCVSHDLLIGGTWFRHWLVHRYTFNPPDQQMRKKMLDHILFGSRHRSCMHNVRTRRGKSLSLITK